MPSTPYIVFSELKKAVSIVQILEHYGLMGTLTKRGAESLTGPCPIHKGTNPSQFRVHLTKNCWNCFGPCSGGNILDFVAQMEQVDIRKAALLIQAWFGEGNTKEPPQASVKADRGEAAREVNHSEPVETKPTSAPRVSEDGEPRRNTPLSFAGLKSLDPGHASLTRWDLQRETLEHFGVGYCSKGLMKGRIAIPIHNRRGELVAYAGRAIADETGERYKYPEKFIRELELFNLHRVLQEPRLPDEPLILVVDFFDVFRLYEAGFEQAVAVMGEGISAEQLLLLVEACGEGAKLILLFGKDSTAAIEILSKLIGTFFVKLIRPEAVMGSPAAWPLATLRTCLE